MVWSRASNLAAAGVGSASRTAAALLSAAVSDLEMFASFLASANSIMSSKGDDARSRVSLALLAPRTDTAVNEARMNVMRRDVFLARCIIGVGDDLRSRNACQRMSLV